MNQHCPGKIHPTLVGRAYSRAADAACRVAAVSLFRSHPAEQRRGAKLASIWMLIFGTIFLGLTGCSSPDLIILDTNGAPIENAKIVGASLSISGQTTLSNKRGEANIPRSVQKTMWISVSKEGYWPVDNIPVTDDQKNPPRQRPIVVVLTNKIDSQGKPVSNPQQQIIPPAQPKT